MGGEISYVYKEYDPRVCLHVCMHVRLKERKTKNVQMWAKYVSQMSLSRRHALTRVCSLSLPLTH